MSRSLFTPNISILLSVAVVFIVVVCLVVLIRTGIGLFLLWRKTNKKQVLLELLPLRKTEQIPYSTQQLFSLIHGLAKQRSFIQKIIGETVNYSFEIVSSKEGGIRYLIRVNEEDSLIIKHELLSYLSGTTISETNDYIGSYQSLRNTSIVEFNLTNHFAFPLKSQSSLEDHDPMAYLTGAMTKL